jgi:hypothetical protein
MKKRIISLALSAITAVSACPFAVSAEENSSYKNSAMYDEITEMIESKVDEYMTAAGNIKATDDFLSLCQKRPYLPVDESEEVLRQLTYFVNYEKRPQKPDVWLVDIDPTAVVLRFTYSEGITDNDLNKYANEKGGEYAKLYFSAGTADLKGYIKSYPENLDIKAFINELKENGLIETAEIEYGKILNTGAKPAFYICPTSCFTSTEAFGNMISEEDITTNADILEWYSKSNVECEFGVLIAKDNIPENVDFTPYEEINKEKYDLFFYPEYYGYISLTPEEAAKLDSELIANIEYFSAVPYELSFELSLENQIGLLSEINRNVNISSNKISQTSLGGSLPIKGVTIDALNAVNGDANCDDILSIADAAAIFQSLANPDKYKLSAQGEFNADSKGDGLTVDDAVKIQKKLAGITE